MDPWGVACGIPNIRGTQSGLRNPHVVDEIKRSMLENKYDFSLLNNRIGGYFDRQGTYHISEGHHRMTAALEIYRETGENKFVYELIKNVRWTNISMPPTNSVPMPSRYFWSNLKNKLFSIWK